MASELHPALGYFTGWSMLLDYMVNPLICVIWCAKAMMGLFAGTPFWLWACAFAMLFTVLNLRRITATARTNELLTAAMGVVILWTLGACARYLMQLPEPRRATVSQRRSTTRSASPGGRCPTGPRSPCLPTSATTGWPR